MKNVILRMQLWLNDPGNMDKLLAIKNGQQQVMKMMMMTVTMMMATMTINDHVDGTMGIQLFPKQFSNSSSD